MCWTQFKNIGQSSKNLGPSQKTLRPSWCPKLVAGLTANKVYCIIRISKREDFLVCFKSLAPNGIPMILCFICTKIRFVCFSYVFCAIQPLQNPSICDNAVSVAPIAKPLLRLGKYMMHKKQNK